MKILLLFAGFSSYGTYYFSSNFNQDLGLDVEVMLHLFTGGIALTFILRFFRYLFSSSFFKMVRSVFKRGLRQTLLDLLARIEA